LHYRINGARAELVVDATHERQSFETPNVTKPFDHFSVDHAES
jgi:hypothetical protein